jgi:hypothetical protein
MTIPSKGSRKINADGKQFSWYIRKEPTYTQGINQGTLRVAIQSCAEGEPCVLMVYLGVSRPDNWINPHQTAIKPSMIRNMIEAALRNGWRPASQKSPFPLCYPIIRDKA